MKNIFCFNDVLLGVNNLIYLKLLLGPLYQLDTRILYLPTDAPQYKIQAIQALYNKYGGMLFGYILDAVKDERLAEQYLAETFNSIPLQSDEFLSADNNEYCKLQGLARKTLAAYFDKHKNGTETDPPARHNKFINRMSANQQKVFCGLYYCGKTTAGLATELNISTSEVRKLLKEAFTIVRNNSGDAAGVH